MRCAAVDKSEFRKTHFHLCDTCHNPSRGRPANWKLLAIRRLDYRVGSGGPEAPAKTSSGQFTIMSPVCVEDIGNNDCRNYAIIVAIVQQVVVAGRIWPGNCDLWSTAQLVGIINRCVLVPAAAASCHRRPDLTREIHWLELTWKLFGYRKWLAGTWLLRGSRTLENWTSSKQLCIQAWVDKIVWTLLKELLLI